MLLLSESMFMLGWVAGTKAQVTGSWLLPEIWQYLFAVSRRHGARSQGLTVISTSHQFYVKWLNYQNRTSISDVPVVYQNLSQVRKFDTQVVFITTLWSNFHIQLLTVSTLHRALAATITKPPVLPQEQHESFIPVGKMWKTCFP